MTELFGPVEPYDSGMLDVGDGHTIYYECCGNADGQPAVMLHGGPGGGCSPGMRRYFDPDRYRVILLDQRGAGRSRPLASEPDADLSVNTTQHLIADLERLREHLKVSSWVVHGVSWGSTLGLAYAQAHPDRVVALVLAAVGTTSRREVQWITEDVGRIFPREWHRFAQAVPPALHGQRLVDAYATMLFDPDEDVREFAAREWCVWEDAHVSLTPGHQPTLQEADPEFRLRFARLVTHYWRHAAFLGEDRLLRDAALLNGIPGVLIHGRFDVSGPLEAAWSLSRTWTTSVLQVIDDAGHGGGPTFSGAIVDALNRFAGTRRR